MCRASVEPMPSSTGCPKRALKRRWRSAGNDSPAVTVARTLANADAGASVSRSAATKPGLAKNRVGCSAATSSMMPGGVGRRGSRIAVAPTASGNVSAVAEPVGEEQLGDGQEAVVGCHAEHLGGVRVGGRLQAAVAVHHPLRQAGRAGAVQPERRRAGRRRRRRERSTVVELGPPVHRDGEVVAVADDDGVFDGRCGGDDGRQVRGVLGRHDDGPGIGVGHDRGEVGRRQHRRDRHRDDTRPQAPRGTRPGTPARR